LTDSDVKLLLKVFNLQLNYKKKKTPDIAWDKECVSQMHPQWHNKMKEHRKARKYHYKNNALGKSCPYPHQNWSTEVVGNPLCILSPSAQNNMYKTP